MTARRRGGIIILSSMSGLAGKTDTPSLAKLTSSLDSKDETESMSSAAVAEEGLRNIANGPVHIAGEGIREAAKFLATDRAQAIELLSSATSQMYSRAYPIVPK